MAGERGKMILPRRGSGSLGGIALACGALLSMGAMSHVKAISYSDATAF